MECLFKQTMLNGSILHFYKNSTETRIPSLKTYHVNNKDIPNAACQNDDAKHDRNHKFCNYFNDELFFFCHRYIVIHF